MKHMNNLFRILLLLLVCTLLTVPVSANSAPPPRFYEVRLTNYPENAFYVDLLVELSVDDANYSDRVATEYPEGILADSQIVQFNKDGYMSYTFHYKDSDSNIIISEDKVTFFENNYEHFLKFDERETVKLAVLDQFGNIIQISEEFCFAPLGRKISRELGYIDYDVQADKITTHDIVDPLNYIFWINIGTIITILVEVIVSLIFKLKRPKLIAVTNLASQIIMRILFSVFYGLFPRTYIVVVIILEALVYSGEALFYCHELAYIPRKKLVLFTVTANTASLAIGAVINMLILY